jgi:hypothetical protein
MEWQVSGREETRESNLGSSTSEDGHDDLLGCD